MQFFPTAVISAILAIGTMAVPTADASTQVSTQDQLARFEAAIQSLSSIVSVATFAISTASTASTGSTTSTGITYSNAQGWVDDCHGVSIHDSTNSYSPLIADCQQLTHNIVGGGRWAITQDSAGILASYGTCSFWAVSLGKGYASVGNSNIIDLVNTAVNLYSSSSDKVGATGTLGCVGGENGETNIVNWAIIPAGQ